MAELLFYIRVGNNRLWKQHMVAGIDGNISVRINADHIMITPSGKSLGLLSPADMVAVER